MKSAKNIIDKIFLDFTYNVKGANKPEAMDETRSFFYTNLLPKIDTVLSQRGIEGHLRIDSLTIDLEKISLEDLPYRLITELEAELGKHARNAAFTKTSDDNDTQIENDIDSLIFFLENGMLPWHYDKKLHPEKLLIRILSGNRPFAIARLKKVFNENSIALERFILQFAGQQVNNIFQSLAPEEHALLNDWFQFIITTGETAHIARAFRFAIDHTIIESKTALAKAVTEELILPYLGADKSLLPEIVTALPELNGYRSPALTRHQNAHTTFFKTLKKKYSSTRTLLAEENTSRSTSAALSREKVHLSQSKERTESPQTSFTISNAGLVILFPYLQMFFSEMGLVRGEEFTNTAAQLKAVQVLQYLATGTLKTPEHLLALNKVMCGIDIAMPCPGRLRLTTIQKQTCDVLLNAVVTNWPALKNTSIGVLQETFLRRNGALKKDGDNWVLHVERKGVDVLIDELPWGFGVVKFPWNEYFVHVQW
ncbi:MAG: hypothetical protein K0R82_1066 [Flavipsychrobacter sp.]|jgi:hypothetical protein|nr:hypothetical protein [Flavipsychrobacter sp.]